MDIIITRPFLFIVIFCKFIFLIVYILDLAFGTLDSASSEDGYFRSPEAICIRYNA